MKRKSLIIAPALSYALAALCRASYLPYREPQIKTVQAFAGTVDLKFVCLAAITVIAASLPFFSGHDGNGNA